MEPGRANVEEIFTEALQHPAGADRAAYLERACGDDFWLRNRVEALLKAHARAREALDLSVTKEAEKPTNTAGPETTTVPDPKDMGQTVDLPSTRDDLGATLVPGADDESVPRGTTIRYFGDYELKKELGRGGMGVVYEARQVSLNRSVALKMLKAGFLAGDEELRRFQNEAEAVALLDHPAIVPIYEVGEHEGQHYFSMKLVSGGSLVPLLNRYKSDPKSAAKLAAEAADAVAHAHARGVLHRDLKPANILVDDQGHPHVTDFGLAKRVEAEVEFTLSGAILGTPAYMSPEQAEGRRGSITTATDVYGLGALLYASLTGRAPFGGDSVVETIDAVRNRPPESLANVNPRVPRDLAVICLKCLEKEPARRYSSAAALAEDLRRWLAGEPIAARPVGRSTRFWKWCKRNPALASLSAALVLSLLGGLVSTTWKWREAEHRRTELATANQVVSQERNAALSANLEAQRRRTEAEKETAKANTVVDFLVHDILAQASPEKNPRSRGVTVEEALDLASPTIASRFAGQPEIEARVRDMIGRTYRQLGMHEKAEPHLRIGLELARLKLGETAVSTLELMDDLATLLQERSKLAEAESLFRTCLEGTLKSAGPESEEALSGTNNLAVLLAERGKLAEAEPLFRRILEIRSRTTGEESPRTLRSMSNLASVLMSLGRLEESESLARTALTESIRVLGPQNFETLLTMKCLGRVLSTRGKINEAERLSRQLLEIHREVSGPEHLETLIAMNNLALLLQTTGSLDEAESTIRECLEIRLRILGSDHAHSIAATNILASILQDRGRLQEAESLFRRAYEDCLRTIGGEHPGTLIVSNNLGQVLYLLGRMDESESLLRRCLATRQIRGEMQLPATLQTESNLASLLRDRGQPVSAEQLARKALESDRRVLGTRHPQTVQAMVNLAAILLDLGHYAESERQTLEAITAQYTDSRMARDAPFVYSVHGACLAARRRDDEAEPLLIQGYEGLKSVPGSHPLRIREALERVVSFYEARGRIQEANSWRQRRLDLGFPAYPFAPAR